MRSRRHRSRQTGPPAGGAGPPSELPLSVALSCVSHLVSTAIPIDILFDATHRTHPIQITMDRSSISTSRHGYAVCPEPRPPPVASGEVSCRARAVVPVVIQLTPYTSSTRYSLQPLHGARRVPLREGGPGRGGGRCGAGRPRGRGALGASCGCACGLLGSLVVELVLGDHAMAVLLRVGS